MAEIPLRQLLLWLKLRKKMVAMVETPNKGGRYG
jgi:hypothetical protein